MTDRSTSYVHALRYGWLTSFYDPIVRLTTRERIFKQQLIAQANIVDSHTILDIGCGTGTLAIWIKRRVKHANVSGIDGDKNILSIAEQKAQKEHAEIQFDLGLSYELPYPDDTFDRSLSSLFFHHLTLPKKEKTFAEIFRVLKGGGELHVADWGKPGNVVMRLLYYQIQFLDGFQTTEDNVRGLLPELMESAGYQKISINDEVSTMFGTMTLYSAKKPDHF